MWPQLLPEVFDNDVQTVFLGIGSIIGLHEFPDNTRKVVFGAAFVPEYAKAKPDLSKNWDVHFVRGPRTARFLGLPEDMGLGDPAVLLASLLKDRSRTREFISFMPHWESITRGNWQRVCEIAGITFIDPCGTVEDVLNQLLRTDLLITEAMHGAIVADALRIPFVPVLPINRRHRAKWADWAETVDIALPNHRLWPSSVKEARLSFARKPVESSARISRLLEKSLVHAVAHRLRKLAGADPCLSKQSVADCVLERMLEKLYLLKNSDASIMTQCKQN